MFKGLRPVSLVDYPGRIAAVLFTAGCNLDCPWCHNRDLVEPERFRLIPDLTAEHVRSVLEERKDFIDGICITGGEPLIHGKDLRDFLISIRDLSLPVKIDTNGFLPDELRRCYDQGLIAFTAMDIKNSFLKYPATVGLPSVDLTLLERSIDLILSRSPERQFRITRVPGLIEDSDISWIKDRFGIELSVQEFRQTKDFTA